MAHNSNLYIFIHCCIILAITVFYMAMLSGLMPQINGIFYKPAKKMVKIMGFFIWPIVLKRLPHHFFVAVQSIITPRPFNSSAFFFEHFSHRNSGAQSCVEITITRQAMYPRAILLQSTGNILPDFPLGSKRLGCKDELVQQEEYQGRRSGLRPLQRRAGPW